jgi:outer membrane protein OmpA-like peptidoglycan-associated protein
MKKVVFSMLVLAFLSGCANSQHKTVGGAVDAVIDGAAGMGSKARASMITALGGQVVEADAEAAASAEGKAAEPIAEASAALVQLQRMGVGVQSSGGTVTLVLAGAAFVPGSAVIEPEFTATLYAVTQEVKKHAGKIEVTGHTDNVGSESANIELSQQRAISVAKALVGGGVDKSKIKVFGAGPAQPVTTNATAEGRSKNRRVEIKLVSNQVVSTADIF